MFAVIIVFIIIVLYLSMLKPNKSREDKTHIFTKRMYAHRGLHDKNKIVPENTLKAFEEAVKNGYAIELDLHVLKDDTVVVFHDDDLKRAVGVDVKIRSLTYNQLASYKLFKTEYHVPTLTEVLDVIKEQVPILIEIKPTSNTAYDMDKIMHILDRYNGLFCIESFDPRVLLWLRKNKPGIVRGQLSSNLYKDENDNSKLVKLILSNLMLNFVTKPDFIAYNKKYKNNLSFLICSRLYKTVKFAWTIRSQEELLDERDSFEGFIFEGFIPDENIKL